MATRAYREGKNAIGIEIKEERTTNMSKTKLQILSKVFTLFIILAFSFPLTAQLHTNNLVEVYPVESQEVLLNPGIGFMTFQRFNGDDLNPGTGWTEGLPIVYQDFDGNLINENYPQTTIAYFRINWRFIEIEPGVYNWELIDKALKTAAERGQTLMLRISPYEGGEEKDVPVWYRKIIGKENDLKSKKWRVDPENPAYVKYFGGTIAAFLLSAFGAKEMVHIYFPSIQNRLWSMFI